MKPFKLLSSEIIIIIILSLASLAIGMFPTVYRYSVTPNDRVFAGTEFYSDDYSVYLSYIKQGQSGRWTVIDKHTSEPQNGTLMHAEYLLLGKIGSIFGLSPIATYHAARLILGTVFLAVFYFFLKKIFPQNPFLRKLAFFLYITAASFPIFNNDPNLQSKWYMSWFMEIEAIERNTVLPHYLLGYTFFLLTGYQFLKVINTNKIFSRNFLILILLGNILAFVHSAELIILLFTCALYILMTGVIKTVSLRKIPAPLINNLLKLGIFTISVSPILIYFQYQFSVFPWDYAIREWEKSTSHYPFLANFPEYLLAVGPVVIFSFIGIVITMSRLLHTFSLKGKSIRNDNIGVYQRLDQPASLQSLNDNHEAVSATYLLSWLISYFALFYFSYPLLGISQIRFLHNPVFIPLAIFGAIGIINISKFLSSLVFVLSKIPSQKSAGYLIPLLCFITILISFPTYKNTMAVEIKKYNDFSTLIYPFKSQLVVFDWLEKNTKPDDAVLAAYEASSLIPFLSGNTVYAGHLWSTVNWPEKSKKTGDFFSGKMPEDEAKIFLKNGSIKYIYYGFQEYSAGGEIFKYPFLKSLYRNEAAEIFEVE